MKWIKWYILLMAVLLGVYMYAVYKRPVKIDWRPTLSSRDKIPFGTYIVYQNLPAILNHNPTELRIPVYDHTNGREEENEIYILIASSLTTTPTDEDELLKYIERGNTLFMSSGYFSKSFMDTLGFETDDYYFSPADKDSAELKLVNPSLDSSVTYPMLKNTVSGYFSKLDTSRSIVLGRTSQGNVNFIRMKLGKGELYLHTAPLAFTNYFALKERNIRYIEKVLSYLPENASGVFWDEYYKIGRGGPGTPLRVILSKPNLKYAYFTALFTILVFMFFQSKRRQRVIPVLEKPVNATVNFIETISRVYYNQNHHHNIGLKKISYFLDYLRNRYHIATAQLDQDFRDRLSQRSGVPKVVVEELAGRILSIQQKGFITDKELMNLNESILNFKKLES